MESINKNVLNTEIFVLLDKEVKEVSVCRMSCRAAAQGMIWALGDRVVMCHRRVPIMLVGWFCLLCTYEEEVLKFALLFLISPVHEVKIILVL